MIRKTGFTLIELLVVIAIIGILAAIIFPVYSRVKDTANRSSDISNMNAIRTALQLYKTDQGAFPPQLLGYVNPYQTGPVSPDLIPADRLIAALYPKRIDSLTTLRPAYLRGTEALPITTTNAVWPSGQIGGLDASPLQRYGPADGLVTLDASGNVGAGGATGGANVVNFYSVSGYETALVNTPGGPQRELRYSPFWSGFGLTGGDATDDPRQLGYSDPPDTTVITWDSYFRDYDQSTQLPLRGGKRDIVLFLGGSARAYDSLDVHDKAWQVKP